MISRLTAAVLGSSFLVLRFQNPRPSNGGVFCVLLTLCASAPLRELNDLQLELCRRHPDMVGGQLELPHSGYFNIPNSLFTIPPQAASAFA